MDLTIRKEGVHLIMATETSDSTILKVDTEVRMINLNDPKKPTEPFSEDRNNYAAGLSYNMSKKKFLNRVVVNESKVHLPYEIWASRSAFNDANVVWYDENKAAEVNEYLKIKFGIKQGESLFAKIKLQQHNE